MYIDQTLQMWHMIMVYIVYLYIVYVFNKCMLMLVINMLLSVKS